jgi:hypothetical protein
MAHSSSLGVPPGVAQSWRQVHHLLAERSGQVATLAELQALGSYYYHLYKAFGHPADAHAAQRMLAGLATQLAQPGGSSCPAGHADYACALAWLSKHLAAEGLPVPLAGARLAGLDHELLQLGLHAPGQPTGSSRRTFFRVVRYFDLRRPAPVALAALRQLLAAPLLAGVGPGEPPGGAPLRLDLAGGLASELLTISRLANAGIDDQRLQWYVREGVRQLLSVKQAIDFSGQRYALFPYQVEAGSQEPAFSAELSWRRGDMGQALLLYTASELFADTELTSLAELVGLNTLLRTTAESTGVASATFQRGAAGVAQLYYRLYVASNQLPHYYQGYLFWLRETQRWLGQELAGNLYQPREATLREGLPGVGLVLLAAATGTGHNWDDLLL